MSSATPAQQTSLPSQGACTVRRAGATDLKAAIGAVRELLVELGGTPPPIEEMEKVGRQLIEQPDAGVLLIAEQGSDLVGVAAASYQLAIHTAGRYALLQDLWVKPTHRSAGVGAQLIEALCVQARELGLPRVEVGLPSDDFSHIEATRGFYLRNGFAPLGPRMRLALT
ncbi:MAG: GNAT family N-acetyltransferase [Solirubrobacteraceae bacterium]